MKSCKPIEKLMAEALLDTLSESRQIQLDKHLRNCQSCAREYRELQTTLQSMKARKQPEPDAVFMESLWMRLSPRLNDPSGWQRFTAVTKQLWQPRLAFPVTAALCLFLGIWIGRIFQYPVIETSLPRIADSEKGQLINAENRAYQMLDRSQRILLAIVNFDPATDETDILDLPQQKTVAEALIQEARTIKPAFSEHPNKRLETLVRELETILLQIANLETDNNPDHVALIQTGVQSILFKIQLTGFGNDAERSGPTPSQKI